MSWGFIRLVLLGLLCIVIAHSILLIDNIRNWKRLAQWLRQYRLDYLISLPWSGQRRTQIVCIFIFFKQFLSPSRPYCTLQCRVRCNVWQNNRIIRVWDVNWTLTLVQKSTLQFDFEVIALIFSLPSCIKILVVCVIRNSFVLREHICIIQSLSYIIGRLDAGQWCVELVGICNIIPRFGKDSWLIGKRRNWMLLFLHLWDIGCWEFGESFFVY